MGVNVAVFLSMVAVTGSAGWSAQTLLAWGGNLGLLSLHGQFWRLFTATYLHANFQHILGNMVLLAITGHYVGTRIGPLRFILAYTLCGVMASLLSAWGNPQVVSVGASGAIAGILGIMVAFYASGRCPEISGKWMAQTVGINAVYSLAPNVDWLAHLGGFAAGLVCGAGLLTTSVIPPRSYES